MPVVVHKRRFPCARLPFALAGVSPVTWGNSRRPRGLNYARSASGLAMSQHCINPDDEWVECPGCPNCWRVFWGDVPDYEVKCDSRVHGRPGRIHSDVEREIEVFWHHCHNGNGWYWRRIGRSWCSELGPCDIEAEALTTARKALSP